MTVERNATEAKNCVCLCVIRNILSITHVSGNEMVSQLVHYVLCWVWCIEICYIVCSWPHDVRWGAGRNVRVGKPSDFHTRSRSLLLPFCILLLADYRVAQIQGCWITSLLLLNSLSADWFSVFFHRETQQSVSNEKVKASQTHYRALGPELIPGKGCQPAGDYKSSTRR